MKDYTQEATYLRIALALQHISVHQSIAEQIVETLEQVQTKQGDFNIHDAVEIEQRYKQKREEETKTD